APNGSQSTQPYDHFSLLRTLEAGFGLPCLNHACDSTSKVMVGSRTGAPARVSPATFPAPATSNAACGVIALRSRVWFTSRVMRPDGRGAPNAEPDARDSR